VPQRSFKPKRRLLSKAAPENALCHTFVFLLPLYYNPDPLGARKRIEPEKWRVTMMEIERLFPGYQQLQVSGWNSEDNVRDDLVRFEIDLIVTPVLIAVIRRWRPILERRFEQRSIYMKVSGPVIWL